jgi:hypothetical protein
LDSGCNATFKSSAASFSRVESTFAVLFAEVQRGKGRIPVADYFFTAAIKPRKNGLPEQELNSMPSALHEDLSHAHSTASSLDTKSTFRGSNGDEGPAEQSHAVPGEEKEAGRDIYTFCMCPGGQIVPTSTNPDELCINGMSFRCSPTQAPTLCWVTPNGEDFVLALKEWKQEKKNCSEIDGILLLIPTV